MEGCVEEVAFRSARIGGDDGKEGKEEVWGVACPECEAVMRAVNVEMAVMKKVYNR